MMNGFNFRLKIDKIAKYVNKNIPVANAFGIMPNPGDITTVINEANREYLIIFETRSDNRAFLVKRNSKGKKASTKMKGKRVLTRKIQKGLNIYAKEEIKATILLELLSIVNVLNTKTYIESPLTRKRIQNRTVLAAPTGMNALST
jgi:hypothetical protein